MGSRFYIVRFDFREMDAPADDMVIEKDQTSGRLVMVGTLSDYLAEKANEQKEKRREAYGEMENASSMDL
jgi:hypothetical protein